MKVIETFYILDLDRCLGDTNKLQELLEEVLEQEIGFDRQAIVNARREYEESGESFDTVIAVEDILDRQGKNGRELWAHIERVFVEESKRRDMLLPYARELLDFLQERHDYFGIVTYGGNLWQRVKMAATGLAKIPYIVTPIKEKSKLLSSWQLHDGSFSLPEALSADGFALQAKHLTFIDDKPVSFMGLPQAVKGICAIAPGVVWPDAVLAALPKNVEIIQGLGDVRAILSR